MTLTMASSGHGVDLVARLHDRPPFVVRGDTLRAAASAMRTLLAAERARRVAEVDHLDEQLARIEAGPVDFE